MTLVVLQPGYLPWLGFFDQMRQSDIFVYYDDVQFDRGGWRNRNRVKSPEGQPHWLTVPVRTLSLAQPINEIMIDNRQPWARKHIKTLRQFYAKAPFLGRYLPELEEVLAGRTWDLLVDLDEAVAQTLCGWLDLKRSVVRSSSLGIGGERSERLLSICQHFGAQRYLSGSAARDYLDVELFADAGIQVEWHDFKHPTYPQQHGAFVPYLSVIDLLLNCGGESLAILRGMGGS